MKKGQTVEYIDNHGVTIRGVVRRVNDRGFVEIVGRRALPLNGTAPRALRGKCAVSVFDCVQVSHWN